MLYTQQLQVNPNYCFNYALVGDRQAPSIVFLHGWLGALDEFTEVASALPEYQCLLLDLPGHGQTKVTPVSNYQMAPVAQALIELLQQLNLHDSLLVGYSMGGRLALYLSIYWPEYFGGVILESASPGLRTQAERERRIQQDDCIAQRLEHWPLAEFLQWWYDKPLFTSLVRHPDFAVTKRLRNNPLELAQSLRQMGLGRQPSLWDQLSTMQLSVLLVVGDLDHKFVTINQQMQEICYQSELKLIANCGHNIHFECPDKLLDLIRYFYDKLLV